MSDIATGNAVDQPADEGTFVVVVGVVDGGLGRDVVEGAGAGPGKGAGAIAGGQVVQ